MVLYKKWHLIGLELGVSGASVGVRREPTGVATCFNADVVAIAKRNLRAGEMLDGVGGRSCRLGDAIKRQRMHRDLSSFPGRSPKLNKPAGYARRSDPEPEVVGFIERAFVEVLHSAELARPQQLNATHATQVAALVGSLIRFRQSASF